MCEQIPTDTLCIPDTDCGNEEFDNNSDNDDENTDQTNYGRSVATGLPAIEPQRGKIV